MKPQVRIKAGSNVFDILAACSAALKREGQFAQAEALKHRVLISDSREPEDVLAVCSEYVDPVQELL